MSRINTVQSAGHVARDCATWPIDQQQRWLKAFSPSIGDPPWVRQTQYQNAGVYSRYLACASHHGLPLAANAAALRAFVLQCEAGGVCTRTVSGYMWAIYKVSRYVSPERDLKWLYRSCMMAERRAKLTIKRKSGCIAPAEEILHFGLSMIGKAKRSRSHSGWRAVQLYRDGLLLVVGIAGPERLRALTSMSLGDLDGDLRTVRYAPSMIKTKNESIRTYPDLVVALLREWIEEWRPIHAGDHDGVWLAKGGGRAGSAALAHAMRVATARAPWGYSITPHRLRDAAATLMVQESPAVARLASQLLGHKNEQMTREYTETARRYAVSRDVVRLMEKARVAVGRRVRAASSRNTIHNASRLKCNEL